MTLTARTVPRSQSRAQAACSGSAPLADRPSSRSKSRRFPINSRESPMVCSQASCLLVSHHEQCNFFARDGNSTMREDTQKIAAATLYFHVKGARELVSSGAPAGRGGGPRSGGPGHARNSRSRDVIVLAANATILLCPPLSPATIKRTPRRQAALRRHRETLRGQRPLVASLGVSLAGTFCTVGCFIFQDVLQCFGPPRPCYPK